MNEKYPITIILVISLILIGLISSIIYSPNCFILSILIIIYVLYCAYWMFNV